jgi:hypothetical protein
LWRDDDVSIRDVDDRTAVRSRAVCVHNRRNRQRNWDAAIDVIIRSTVGVHRDERDAAVRANGNARGLELLAQTRTPPRADFIPVCVADNAVDADVRHPALAHVAMPRAVDDRTAELDDA